MSSVPPNVPPGGGWRPPNQPFDSKAQWKVYREQQKAAWRAQRDAWKAQRDAWKSGYGGAGAGVYGPRVPSLAGPVILVAVGVVALLVVTGRVAFEGFVDWYGHWWPLLLIVAGLALLAEWAIDMRREVPVRRSGGFVGILIFLAFLGICSSGWNRIGPWRAQWGDHDDGFFNAFGLPEHDLDQEVLKTSVPANATIDIQNPRGDISITAGDSTEVQVQAHEVAYASSDAAAKKIFDAEAADVKVSGSAVLVRSNSSDSGRLNLNITVPKSAQVTVHAGKGDVTAAGLNAGINVTAPHGDIQLSTVSGAVQVHFSNEKHDFSAHDVHGDITADGRCNDMTISEVKGKIEVNGDIFGDVHLQNVSGPIHIRTSVTELQVASLPGDVTLNDDDLHVTEAKGEVRVTTHSKNVDLSDIYGDSFVQNRDGNISVAPAGNFNVDAKSTSGKGDVEVSLAPNAQVNVEGRTRNGDIESDYPLTISGDESKTVSGKVGSGSAKITVSTDVGDLRIKRGSPAPPEPPAPGADLMPKPPSPNAPHLKAPKAPPAEPVTQ